MRKNTCVWGLLLLLSLCGCASPKKETTLANLKSEDPVGVMKEGTRSEFSGGYLMEIGNETSMMVFFDSETKTLVPLCSKPDCNHANESCTAILLADEAVRMCVYDGKLWYINGNEFNELTVWRADTTGENAEKMFALEGMIGQGNIVLYDGFLYIRTEKLCMNDLKLIEGKEEGIYRVNMENGEITETGEKQRVDRLTRLILGYFDQKIYLQFTAQSEAYPEGAVIAYDCETGEMSRVALRECEMVSAGMNSGCLVYSGYGEETSFTAVVDLKTGEELEYVPSEFTGNVTMMGKEAILGIDGEEYCFDFEERTLEKLENEDMRSKFSPFWSDADGYLGYLIERDYLTEVAYISKDDYQKGKEPVTLTRNGLPIG